MKSIRVEAEFCVVGGGLAGLCAAVAASRRGVKTVLMHDRPVLGGNASSEIRMWVCGAHGENMRETGLIEEIQLENRYRNSSPNYSVWDSILYEKARFQENLTLFLNCSCCSAEVADGKIKSVKGWQLTTETWVEVSAGCFADCSGDSILAPLSGAEFRMGREARSEFGESIPPEKADKYTMGMSCLIQARETDRPQPFIPPAWAYKYDEAFFTKKFGKKLTPYKGGGDNFWWLEIGGMGDTLHDAEKNRDELLKISFGVWDYIKNGPDAAFTANWMLDWMGFLPGKRESRRCVGDHMLNENDVLAEGRFDDIIGYGGWSMDDHYPEGFYHEGGVPTIFHPAPSPYGIPYRCLYSRNVGNLFFAGRNISATHAAMSSSRVMGTCAILGQAVGTAAALAVRHNLTPRGVYESRISELQAMLMDDDCYLPWKKRPVGSLAREAALSASCGSPEAVLNGVDRPVGPELNAWQAGAGDHLEFSFKGSRRVSGFRVVFDSRLSPKLRNMPCNYPRVMEDFTPPATLVSDFRIETRSAAGQWETAAAVKGNYQRLVKLAFNPRETSAVRLVIEKTRGEAAVNIFAAEPV
jgi:hypothetical protein